MPKKPFNYQKAVIYKIHCKDTNIKELYIGSTTQFNKRKFCHKYNCNNENITKKYNINVYIFIRENGGWDNWFMTQIKEFPCNSKQELEAEERKYILDCEKGMCLNIHQPTRTLKEWKNDNKEYILESRKKYDKKYYEKNKDKITQYKKSWAISNKDKITEKSKLYREKNKEKLKSKMMCDCGSQYIYNGKSKHLKTKKHMNYIKSIS